MFENWCFDIMISVVDVEVLKTACDSYYNHPILSSPKILSCMLNPNSWCSHALADELGRFDL